ncbi:hypothetical protein D3C80_1855290 [compost metagenome]
MAVIRLLLANSRLICAGVSSGSLNAPQADTEAQTASPYSAHFNKRLVIKGYSGKTQLELLRIPGLTGRVFICGLT